MLAAIRRITASVLAALVMFAVAVPGAVRAEDGSTPTGYPQGHLSLDKTVDGEESVTVERSDSFLYQLRVGCDDNPCVNAVLEDPLPAEFAGFTISSARIVPTTVGTLTLSGCEVGGPVTGDCLVRAAFTAPLDTDPAAGGIPAAQTYRVEVRLVVPTGLPPSWPHNGNPVVNTATLTADNASSVNDPATVTVTVPVEVGVHAAKDWAPASQEYAPGAASTFTIGGASTANVPAASLVLTDAPGATADATSLAVGNPFNTVDFAGLCSPSSLPEGADRVQVDLYALDADTHTWNWVNGTAAASATLPSLPEGAAVGGIRLTYTSSTGTTIEPGGDPAAQCVKVVQRATNRTTGDALVHGTTVENTVTATLTVPGRQPATDTARDTLAITPLSVSVTPGKTIAPDTLPAGDDFTVELTGRNSSNGSLNQLTISEPAGEFLNAQLAFSDFEAWTWPTGATEGEFTWNFADGGTLSVPLTPTGGAPSVPAGRTITGFTARYTGTIPDGTTARIGFSVATDPTLVPDGSGTGYRAFTNTVEVTGTNPAGTDEKTASDEVRVYHPEIQLSIDKTIRPTLVTPGGTVLAELLTQTAANSARVQPTEIVVEDSWDGTADTAFWDGFRAREISFVQVPSGATMKVEYATGVGGSQSWTVLDTNVDSDGLYSTDLVARLGLATADAITGLRFTFTDPEGFAQGTIVKPNVQYVASGVLRGSGAPTAAVPGTATSYDNRAVASGKGEAAGRPVTSDPVRDNAHADIIRHGSDSGDGTGPGTLLSGKRWVQSDGNTDLTMLPSQSGATAYTAHTWGVSVPGYDSVVLSDALPGQESTPGVTTFQAFDLVAVRPVSFTQDPLLRWDTVSSVELFDGTTWRVVPAPSGTWMSATGFKGYNLTAPEQASTTGVRITVLPNVAARAASTEPGRPAPASGVASSATGRPLWLQWHLRNDLRVPGATPWVTATVGFNEATGVIRNDFQVATTGPAVTLVSSDTIPLVDKVPGVGTEKAVSSGSLVVPAPGDVAARDFPRLTFTVKAWNTSQARAAQVRMSDPSTVVTAATNPGPDVFTGVEYDPATNPFERFAITGLDFTSPAVVDQAASKVALWHYNPADGSGSVQVVSITAAKALDAAALADVVGVSVVYQSSDPAATGGLIPQGNASTNLMTMTITTQLRPTLRTTGAVTVGAVRVDNLSTAQSYDPVNGANLTPNAAGRADVTLLAPGLDVTASKTITPETIVETAANVPVTVTLGATDGSATVAAETVTIADTDADFWDSFALNALGSVTLPAGADQVRVDVQLDDSADWVEGTASGTAALPGGMDSAAVTGIRFVFSRADGKPLSTSYPSADWQAQAVLDVRLREGATFPGSVENTVTTQASHRGYEPATAEADDTVTLSSGTTGLDVRKDPSVDPKVVEPGVSVPWTLTFTNVGTSKLHVNKLVDNLGPWLRYDGAEPRYASTPVAGSVGLRTTGITVTQSAVDDLTFTFPEDAAPMAPGDSFTVTVGIILLPGLQGGQKATNSFQVDTDETIPAGACVNTSGNAQGILSGLGEHRCGTSNFVTPEAGPLLLGEKEVRGEIDGDLVDGAANIVHAAQPCVASPGGFYRTSCVPYTTIGATDEWRIGGVNTGTVPYATMTFVDVLPTPGDRLLATSANRGSAWRPVFDLGFGVQPTTVETWAADGIPEGTTSVVEVSTADNVCFTDGTWLTDPTCSAVTWTPLASFTGDASAITAVRVSLDFTRTDAGALQPGGSIHLLYRTTNVPWRQGDSPTAQAVRPELRSGTSPIAWNQTGVAVTLSTTGQSIRRAPEKSGVQLATGTVELRKTVSGEAAANAPASVTMDLACTVPDGRGGSAPVALGDSATLSVPVGGAAKLNGLPLGATCGIGETGETGKFGEAARTPATSQQVLVTALTGALTPPAQSVTVDNRYDKVPPVPPTSVPPTVVPQPEPTVKSDTDGVVEGSSHDTLAFTGADWLAATALALVFAVIGGALVGIRRRGTRTARRAPRRAG